MLYSDKILDNYKLRIERQAKCIGHWCLAMQGQSSYTAHLVGVGLVEQYIFSPKIPSYYGSFFMYTSSLVIMGLFYVQKIPNIMGLFMYTSPLLWDLFMPRCGQSHEAYSSMFVCVCVCVCVCPLC